MRGCSLTREAVHTLATHRGGLRERLLAIDPEFFSIPPFQLPQVQPILDEYARIRSTATAIAPSDSEGRLAATFSKSRYVTLERLAGDILAFHLTLSETRPQT